MKAKRAVLVAIVAVLTFAAAASGSPSPTSVHFTAAGDIGSRTTSMAVLRAIANAQPDLHLALGDLSYGVRGAEQDWCDLVTGQVGAGFPFQLLAGNHESNGLNGNINDFSACLPNQMPGAVGTYGRQYYLDVPKEQPLVRFVIISPGLTFPEGPTDYTAGSDRYRWTESAIDSARAAGIPWTVVAMHKPCLSVGMYGCGVPPDLVHLLMYKKVDLVLMGHEHNYQRTKQLSLGRGCTSLSVGSYNPACVIDDDDEFVAGRGVVFQTVGTGGGGLREIVETDPEMGYFAAVSGSDVNPTYGVADVQATSDVLSVNFRRAAGGTYTDLFRLARPEAPLVNEPPVATFMAAVDGAAVAFDATSSTDPDGVVVAHSWAFGDGEYGAGANPQHTYAKPGTYDVTLTVTDDGGASRAVTQQVEIPKTLASDEFERAIDQAWGTATSGPAWSTPSKTGRSWVGGGAGHLTMTGGGSRLTAYLREVLSRDVEVSVRWGLDQLPAGTAPWVYQSIMTRQVLGVGYYKAMVKVSSTGSVRAVLQRNLSGTDRTLGEVVVPGLTYAVGDTLHIRAQTVGVAPTTLRVKVWKAGTSEPDRWTLVRTDPTAELEGDGAVGFVSLLSKSVTNAPVDARFDEFRLRELTPAG